MNIDNVIAYSPEMHDKIDFLNPLAFPVDDILFAYWWSRFREELSRGMVEPNYIDTEMHRLGRLRKRKSCIFQFDLTPVSRELAIQRTNFYFKHNHNHNHNQPTWIKP